MGGGLISINKHKKQEKVRSVLLRKKKNGAELAEETSKKREAIHDVKEKEGKTLFKRRKK